MFSCPTTDRFQSHSHIFKKNAHALLYNYYVPFGQEWLTAKMWQVQADC